MRSGPRLRGDSSAPYGGGPIRSQEYGAAGKDARRKVLTPARVASPLAAPNDLRHACVSFWLRSGVSLAETARRAGQNVAVLQRYYAKVLDDEEAKMNALTKQGFAARGRGESVLNPDRRLAASADQEWDTAESR